MKTLTPLAAKLVSTNPAQTCRKVGEANRRFSTALNGGAWAATSAASEWPRTGSRRVNLASRASSSPGRPTTMKAVRQLKVWAIQPPATAPSIEPSGTPAV